MSPLLKFWCTSCYTFSSIKWCKSISICILLNMGFYILLPMYLFILLCHLPCHWTYSECHSGQHWTVVLWCLMAVWYWFSIIYLTNNMEWDSWRIVKWKKLQDNKFSLMLRIPLQSRKPGFHPWVGRSPGEGNGYSLQYFCLENPMDRGAWWAIQSRGSQSQTWVAD